MAAPKRLTAQAALNAQRKTAGGAPIGKTAKFVCAYHDCQTFAVHHWGYVGTLTTRPDASTFNSRNLGKCPEVAFSLCEACGRESVYIGGTIIRPAESDAPAPAPDMPADLHADYEEARAILTRSPRASAALLRQVIAKLLPHLGATQPGLKSAIAELIAAGRIKKQIQQALDTVRVLGDESVGPGQLDKKDSYETALALFHIVNLIVETEIAEPRRFAALYAALPKGKEDGVVKEKFIGFKHLN